MHDSSSIIPDISVFVKGYDSPVLFAKVVSDHKLSATIRKLCFDLVTQLICLRNTDIEKTSVQGFVLSVSRSNKDLSGVVFVTIKWNLSELLYVARFQRITKDLFADIVLLYDTI